MTDLFWILVGLAAVAFVMSIVFGMMLWRMQHSKQDEQLDERLQTIGARIRQQESFQVKRKYSQIPWLEDRLSRHGFLRNLDKRIISAGFNIPLDRFLLKLFIAVVIVALSISSLDLSIWIVLLAIVSTVVLPILFLRSRVRSRAKQFEEQLPDVLEFVARSMQAGHAFGSAIQMAAKESPEPIASEFGRAQTEINFGVPTPKALAELAERIGSADMRFFAVAVAINREVGGDLAGLLEGVASLIRQRIDMRDSVNAMSSEGRFTAVVLGGLPFLIAGVLMLVDPGSLNVLWTDPNGRNLLFAGLGLMAVGVIWMRKMIRIKV